MQNPLVTDVIQTDDSYVRAIGQQVQATTHIGRRQAIVFGGEVYRENIESYRRVFDPVRGTTTEQRALYPNDSRYQTAGYLLQDTLDVIPGRLRAVGGVRFTHTRYSTNAEANRDANGVSFGVPDSSQSFHDWTFNTSRCMASQSRVQCARIRLPPQEGGFRIWYTPSGRRPWFLINSRFTGPQLRLNGADIDDDRIGASRRRSDIAAFFRAGVVSPFITQGTDGRMGTADDVFSPTGETSLQIQNRVLPLGSTINGVQVTGDGIRVPLYIKTSGWWTLDLQGGMPLSEHLNVQSGITNVFDRNYRLHGSGVDAPGFNVYLGVRYVF
jgi:outer membrane receptor protein involved in Fe transport